MAVDLAKPLELECDGTPVVWERSRAQPDEYGVYWVVREDGKRFTAEQSGWQHGFKSVCVPPDGIRFGKPFVRNRAPLPAHKLTAEDRDLCDKFEAFLQRLMATNEALTGVGVSVTTTYGHAVVHISGRAFSGGYDGPLTDRLQGALDRFRAESDPEERVRQRRIKALRDELAQLERAA